MQNSKDTGQEAAGMSLMDPAVQEHPYSAYQTLRDECPVYKDPVAEFYIVSRHQDIKAILADPETFSSTGKFLTRQRLDPARWERVQAIYDAEGWKPVPSLAHRDDPEHKQMRAIWDRAFRPSKINELEPRINEIIDDLFAQFIDRGECDWVSEFAIPLPLRVICSIMGAPEDDIWKIRKWVDSWIAQGSMLLSEEEEIQEVREVVKAQHYFQAIIERLREHPDETLFSDVVNTEIPEWGRKLTDHELQASMFADLFAAGSETTASALASGMMLLIQNPDVWERVSSDPGKYVRPFVEEVLRLESPTQGLTRTTTRDVELHGVKIPKGSVIHMRFGAANRDERQFENPTVMDLDRKHGTTHLAFGGGTHHCVGAPLARRELLLAFTAVAKRLDNLRFAPGKNDFSHHPSMTFRALKALHIHFDRRSS